MPNVRMPIALIDNSIAKKTKAEIAARAQGEKALTTSEKMEPPKGAAKNKAAHAYWKRIVEILATVGMDEAFYERTLWRYCVLLAEHDQLAEEREKRAGDIEKLREREGEMEAEAYYGMLTALGKALDSTDRQIAKKRDQLLAIEKENLMTVQGKLRAVPKKAEEKKPSGIEAFRMARG